MEVGHNTMDRDIYDNTSPLQMAGLAYSVPTNLYNTDSRRCPMCGLTAHLPRHPTMPPVM